MMKSWLTIIVLAGGLSQNLPQANAAEYTFVVTQLTNDSLNDSGPQVSGLNVVWQSKSGSASATSEIWMYDGKAVNRLTDNNFLDEEAQVSGNHVTWSATPAGAPSAANREIFYYDGLTTTRLTNDAVRDMNPQISGSLVVWEHGDGNAKDIHRSNGAPLTADGIVDAAIDVSGSRVVWVHGSVPAQKVMLFDGATTIAAGSSTLAINNPQVSDSLVVWRSSKNTNIDSSGFEIYRYDGTNAKAPTNLSNNDIPDFDPQVSGNNVVWWGGFFGDRQIYLNDGATTTTISSGTMNSKPRIDGKLVTWQGNDGDDEIFFWDGTTAVQVTQNGFADTNPRISGNHIVWEAAVDGGDIEIMSALRVIFGDANFDGVVDIGDYTVWADNFLASDAVFARGDFNQNGVVDIGDYTLWADNFLASDSLVTAAAPPLSTLAVPEPSSNLLACLAAAAGLAGRQRSNRVSRQRR